MKLPWPPVPDRPYPDLALTDSNGRIVRLSSLKGKVVLIEPVGMNCPACLSMAGANRPEIGTFAGIKAEAGPSVEEALDRCRIDPGHPDLVYVQLLLYDLGMAGAEAEDAAQWERHFKPGRFKSRLVLAGGQALVGPASYDLIPGLQVVDRDFVMRYDSAGHNPRMPGYQVYEGLASLLGSTDLNPCATVVTETY